MELTIKFLGAAGTVTGSKFLLETPDRKILVDCGLFQGLKDLRLRNREKFPVDPTEIDVVILTHAHLDHSGILPLLVKQGFCGPIFCTEATRDITEILLNDFARIEMDDAKRANREGFSKHTPALPIYTERDVNETLRLMVPKDLNLWHTIFPGIRFRFAHAGHILGAATVNIKIANKTILFTGDLGRSKPLLLKSPSAPLQCDYLVCESTYGDRVHEQDQILDQLEFLIKETTDRGGIIIIPSFAVGRTQDILFLLSQLKQQKRLPEIPIILDSPMAIRATEIFLKWRAEHRLSELESRQLSQIARMVRTGIESQKILSRIKQGIVIAGSGMVTGGRVLSSLEKFASESRNLILLTGFQAVGTRGRLLQDGAKEIKFWGQYHSIGARVSTLTGLSAHADQRELLDWMKKISKGPKKCFLVHGEAQAADALRIKIRDTLGWDIAIPRLGEIFDLA